MSMMRVDHQLCTENASKLRCALVVDLILMSFLFIFLFVCQCVSDLHELVLIIGMSLASDLSLINSLVL